MASATNTSLITFLVFQILLYAYGYQLYSFLVLEDKVSSLVSMFNFWPLMTQDIDYIIWTGDLPPHDIWNQTKESNLNILRATIDQLILYFPSIPIFPALGNHESAPVNRYWKHFFWYCIRNTSICFFFFKWKKGIWFWVKIVIKIENVLSWINGCLVNFTFKST